MTAVKAFSLVAPCFNEHEDVTEGRARTGPVAAGRRLAPGRVSPRRGGPPPSGARPWSTRGPPLGHSANWVGP
jgi:hypothetical protein